MITIDNLSFSYTKEQLLKNISINLNTGIHSIIGINGSGKTTLLKLICGLLVPNSGSITFNGTSKFRKQVAYVGVDNYFFSHITGREHLDLFENHYFDTSLWERILKLPLDSYISTYSTGMKKKLALLTGLKRNKDIYVLDEPFNGLDLESSYIINRILNELNTAGKLIILSSHIIDILENISDKYYLLTKGQISNQFDSGQFALLKQTVNEIISDENDLLIQDAFKKSKT